MWINKTKRRNVDKVDKFFTDILGFIVVKIKKTAISSGNGKMLSTCYQQNVDS